MNLTTAILPDIFSGHIMFAAAALMNISGVDNAWSLDFMISEDFD